jgi:hypothetical protein
MMQKRLRGRCKKCRGALKLTPRGIGQMKVKQLSCHCRHPEEHWRFSRPRKGGRRRK